MNSRRVPVDLREKIRSYFQVKYPSKRVFDEAELITSIESPFLRKDIVTHLFHDLVATVPLFQLVDRRKSLTRDPADPAMTFTTH